MVGEPEGFCVGCDDGEEVGCDDGLIVGFLVAVKIVLGSNQKLCDTYLRKPQ